MRNEVLRRYVEPFDGMAALANEPISFVLPAKAAIQRRGFSPDQNQETTPGSRFRGNDENHDTVLTPMYRNDDWVADVIRFWFDELRPAEWWRGSARVDEMVRARFASLQATLVANPPRSADLDARGHLATVLVFDQFSRHLFRDTAEAYASDPLALATALDAIDRGLDRALPDRQRHFLYMPLMHSEDPAMQERSVATFAALPDPQAHKSAREHRDTIACFGRFPSRNAALGRASTDAERTFLARQR